MLRIKIELVPFGIESEARTIADMEIINDGTGNHRYGNYIYELWDANGDSIKGELKKHNRIQSAFRLIQAVLNKALPEEELE